MSEVRASRAQRRRILLAAGASAGVGAAAYLATPGAVTQAWPHGAPQSVSLSGLAAGRLLTVEWQGKPVWVLRRTPAEVAALAGHESELADPESLQSIQPPACRNRHRSLDPTLFVAIGLCTHQGCVPAHNGGRGFLCPCHTSKYDLAGRVFKVGPATANLVIPAYRLAGEQLVIGAS